MAPTTCDFPACPNPAGVLRGGRIHNLEYTVAPESTWKICERYGHLPKESVQRNHSAVVKPDALADDAHVTFRKYFLQYGR